MALKYDIDNCKYLIMNQINKVLLIIVVFLFNMLTNDACAKSYPEVFIEYAQLVNGYKVNVEFLSYTPVGELSEIGHATLHFSHKDGYGFSVTCEYYSDVALYRNEYIVKDNDHIKLDYIAKDHEYLPSESPFYFADMDFDGRQELVVVNWVSGGKGGHCYDVYDIDAKHNLIQKTKPPFDAIEQYFTVYDKPSQTIVNSDLDGVFYYAEHFYKKNKAGDFYLDRSVVKEGDKITTIEY